MSEQIAEQATMQSFLNCYMRETSDYDWLNRSQINERGYTFPFHESIEAERFVWLELAQQQLRVIVPVIYYSLTGRHLFAFPMYFASQPAAQWVELDYVTLTTLLTKELALKHKIARFPSELVFRVLESCQHIESFITSRQLHAKDLYQADFNFLQTEQSLLFGHLLHPTPKSRQGLTEWEQVSYSPEHQGQFPLYYFAVDHSIVKDGSSLEKTATQLIKEDILSDTKFSQEIKKQYVVGDRYSIMPVHPLQAQHLLREKQIQRYIQDGLLIDLGLQGKDYYPTSSLRTLYHPQSRHMYKFSVNIKITNSKRVNKYKELERGVEVSRILKSQIGTELGEKYPGFHIIKDPAFMTINVPGKEESGFELSLRENPFYANQDEQVSLIAGLCQDALPGHQPLLFHVISKISQAENRSLEAVSLDWFQKYLTISLEPMMWLYLTYGIALEAHQQNSVVKLDDVGYPHSFYYRDNQGYYYCESTLAQLRQMVPGLNDKSDTACPDAVIDERFRYYFFLNHLTGIIQTFGALGFIAEDRLLSVLYEALEKWQDKNRLPSTLIQSLLTEKKLTCKGNLLTRLYDMDELVGSVEHQSVYVEIPNPFLEEINRRDKDHAI